MSGKPISDISTALSIRLPNSICEQIRGFAERENIINATGRMDKRGEINMSQAIAISLDRFYNGSVVQSDSSIVSHTVSQDADSLSKTQINEIFNILSDKIDLKDMATLKSEILTSLQEDSYSINEQLDKHSDRLDKLEAITQSQAKPQQAIASIATESISTELSDEKPTTLSGKALAKRLGIAESTLRKHRDKHIDDPANLTEFTKYEKNTGITWHYDSTEKNYYPIK